MNSWITTHFGPDLDTRTKENALNFCIVLILAQQWHGNLLLILYWSWPSSWPNFCCKIIQWMGNENLKTHHSIKDNLVKAVWKYVDAFCLKCIHYFIFYSQAWLSKVCVPGVCPCSSARGPHTHTPSTMSDARWTFTNPSRFPGLQ